MALSHEKHYFPVCLDSDILGRQPLAINKMTAEVGGRVYKDSCGTLLIYVCNHFISYVTKYSVA